MQNFPCRRPLGLLGRWAAIFVACLACGQLQAVDVWLSPSYKTNAGSTMPAMPGDVPGVNRDHDATGTLFIWGTPDSSKTLANWSFNIVSSNASALRFTAAEVSDYNRELVEAAGMTPAKRRWEFVGEPVPFDTIQGDFGLFGIAGFSIFNQSHAGIGIGTGPAAAGGGVSDPNHVSGAWLLASVDYVTGGSSADVDVFLEIGDIGINHQGENTLATNVRFGHATDNLLNGKNDRSLPSNVRDLKISVSNISTPLGDYNRDGAIDMEDYARWRFDFGKSVTPGAGADGSGDGLIDAVDYAIWRENLPPPGAIQSATAEVPEPSSACLAALACVAIAGKRRRSVLPLGARFERLVG